MDGARTGRGVRIAVIDSGVNASHPHIGRVAGGVTIGGESAPEGYSDVLGHGTAVMAAIQEKAPGAEYFAVRVFHSALRTNVDSLERAIEWSLEQRVHLINLSLGTSNPAHRDRFERLVADAARKSAVLVSARDALPGSLPRVIGVGLCADCPRDTFSFDETPDRVEFFASGYPRPAPGVPPERNLNGISFAVANMTGLAARVCEGLEDRSYESLCAALVEIASSSNPLSR